MAANIEQFEFLKTSVNDRINGINKRRLNYRQQAFYAFFSTAALAALATVLLGLQLNGKWVETIRITALIITSLITLINTFNAFFNHKELWIANNTALNKLYELKFNMEYVEKGSQPFDLQVIDLYKKKYQEILDELNQTWYKSRAETQSR